MTRFVVANRRRNSLLAIVIAVAIAGVVLIGQAGEAAASRADDAGRSTFGEAAIRLPAGSGARLVGGGAWFTREQADRIGEILAIESVTVSPRVEASALVVSGERLTPALILAADDEQSAVSPRALPQIDAILIGTIGSADEAARFLDLADLGLNWSAAGGTEVHRNQLVLHTSARELLRTLGDGGFAPADAVANRLEIGHSSVATEPETRSPAVTAYNAAELLTTRFPGISVLSRIDQAGRSRQVSAGNVALLLQLGLILPALAAVVGIALVSAEARGEQVALLRTLGFASSAIRSIFVREFFLVSTGATAAGLTVGIGISIGLAAVGATSVPLVPIALCGAVIPPGMAFLSLRRFSATPLHEQLAEWRR